MTASVNMHLRTFELHNQNKALFILRTVTYSVTDGSYADGAGDLDGTLDESANVVVVSVCTYVCDELGV